MLKSFACLQQIAPLFGLILPVLLHDRKSTINKSRNGIEILVRPLSKFHAPRFKRPFDLCSINFIFPSPPLNRLLPPILVPFKG